MNWKKLKKRRKLKAQIKTRVFKQDSFAMKSAMKCHVHCYTFGVTLKQLIIFLMPETLSCLCLSASLSYCLYNKCSQCHTNFSCVMSRYNSFTEHTKILLLYCTPAASMWLLSGMTTEAWQYPLPSELTKHLLLFLSLHTVTPL